MDQSPLVTEQINAGQKLINNFNDYKPVSSAFWLREGDAGEWYLYIISPQTDDLNVGEAYRELSKIIGWPADPWLDRFQVKVAGVDNKYAVAMNEVQSKYPAQLPKLLRTRMLAGIYIDEAYIYPPLANAAAIAP